jgi:ParB family chromosome partitioning protein
MDLEFHQLELRYERLRVIRPEQERRLMTSLAEVGQQVPILVIQDPIKSWFVVIDGYKRVRSLRRLGRDTVAATCWPGEEVDALVVTRLMQESEPETAIEQSWFLAELHDRFGLSLEDLSRRFNHSVSWVSRRLALVQELPDSIQQQVRRGEIVAHGAAKYLVPLACLELVEGIGTTRLSSRDLGILYSSYQSGNWVTRQRLLSAPLVFLKSYKEAQSEPTVASVPDDSLLTDFEVLSSVARRAGRRLRRGALQRLPEQQRRDLATCLQQAAQEIQKLTERFDKEMADAGSEPAGCDSEAARTGT